MRNGLIAAFISTLLFGNMAAAQQLSVAFVNPGKQGEVFWDMVTNSMQSAASDLDINLEVSYGERDRNQMRDIGFELVERENPPDYLVVVNEEQFGVEIVERANAKGIKSLFLLNDAIGQDAERLGTPRLRLPHWLGSITPDNEGAGERMAHALVAAARNSGKRSSDGKLHFLVIGGDKSTPASIDRLSGMEKGFSKHDDVIIDRVVYANWNSEESERLTTGYLRWAERNGIVPAGVWAANDPIAFGAMRAFEEAEFEPGHDAFFVGLNWSSDAIEEIVEGRMVMTDGGHFLAGAWSMVMLRDYADGVDFADNGWRQQFAMSAIDADFAPELRDIMATQDWGAIEFGEFRRAPGGEYDFGLETLLSKLDRKDGQD